ncbi:MAG: N-acetyltransferase [Actinobacteria bacterium]|nr:N-acetyltransferase [Actinomycetota bacterium]
MSRSRAPTRVLQEHTLIRVEQQEDRAAVHAVNASAFDTLAEADLVDVLRDRAQPVISLVAEEDGSIVGYIMFSPVALPGHPELRFMGLAPLAVVPERQRQGIGSALVRAGLKRCRELGHGAVAVLGHSAYYPRFGFSPSARFGIGCEYDVPEGAFMLVELQPGYLDGVSGTVMYHAAFNNV